MKERNESPIEREVNNEQTKGVIKNKGWYTVPNEEAETKIKNMISGDNKLYLLVAEIEDDYICDLPTMPGGVWTDKRILLSAERNCTQIVGAELKYDFVEDFYDIWGLTSEMRNGLEKAEYLNPNIEIINGAIRQFDRDRKMVLYDIRSPVPENLMKNIGQNLERNYSQCSSQPNKSNFRLSILDKSW